MNQNREIKIAEKEDFVLADSTHKTNQAQQIQDDESSDRFFCIPSVPRPGVTSWSLVS
jgi:hypothetical protein